MSFDIPKSHPRYLSLVQRHRITEGYKNGITASAGLIAHGRGEAFDYLIGEQTSDFASKAIEAAAALLILSDYPIICVNGNSVVLSPKQTVKLAEICNAKLEVNLFYRTKAREKAIKALLIKNGATQVLGVDLAHKAIHLEEIDHARRVIDPNGIAIADTVFVPLEDGDRTQALVRAGKKVITVDLNPLSRTAQNADITIVDNLTRVMGALISSINQLKNKEKSMLEEIIAIYDNKQVLREATAFMGQRMIAIGDQLQ